ncbi:MAG TPA: MBL fold metallo-hydrolase [Candidatus Dormibacteraeota bacterium]|nr:MBL fold metallo-hydrolase [Candidatus Dormibacteraeota bacterium]
MSERVYLVGSGSNGFDLTDPYDCHVYLIDGGRELALIDVGAGMGAPEIIENVRRDGFDPGRIRHVILTHGHADHAGGGARMRKLLGEPATYASRMIAESLRLGDEAAISLDAAKRAGIYPLDYHLEPAPVDHELEEGDVVEVGSLRLAVLDTPGHSDGHLSLLLEDGGQTMLFAGDVIFFGGKILLQNIGDCRLDALITSLRKLRQVGVSALFPGHLTLSLRDGQRHIERANQVLDHLLIPEQMVSAW